MCISKSTFTMQFAIGISTLLATTAFGEAPINRLDLDKVDDKPTKLADLTTEIPSGIVLRIPQSLITKTANEKFHHISPVKQAVLGTISRGVAHCDGELSFQPEENDTGVTFCCRIVGTIRSDTCGINGPAIIQSKTNTSYQAHKRIYFDGNRLVTTPATIQTKTNVAVTDINSLLPGFRGRIITRVATRKTRENHDEAQSIVADLTKQELLQHINTEVDQRVVALNARLVNEIQLLTRLFGGEQLILRSHADCVEIGYRATQATIVEIPTDQKLVGEGVEFWVQATSSDRPVKTSLASLITKAPTWLTQKLANEMPKLATPPVSLTADQPHSWLVFQLLY